MPSELDPVVDRIHQLARRVDRPIQLMEVCGTHTVSIFRHGLRSLLPEQLRLVSGPGCPVCVTAQRYIDAAIHLAGKKDVIVATYGDMVRVPGYDGSLEQKRAAGADVRIVGSAQSALDLARQHLDRTVVFIGVGFETTAPATAAVILEADRDRLQNFTILSAHKRVVPAMLALLAGGKIPLDGFLCPGHVSVIVGSDAYQRVIQSYAIPCVVSGFEPGGILTAISALLEQVVDGRASVGNPYVAAVSRMGNLVALELLDQVFSVEDTSWRALGVIPQSGMRIRPQYEQFDAMRRFGIKLGPDVDHPACRCGEVIQGMTLPNECSLFGAGCTPLNPLGPCMVSSEGTCSAWYKYNRYGDRTSTSRGSGTQLAKENLPA